MRRTLALQSPIGELIQRPSLDDLRDTLFCSPASYWRAGSFSAELLHIRRRGKSIEVRDDIPTLSFAFKPNHGVFLVHCDRDADPVIAIPYAGGGFSPWVKHNDGQLEWYVPRACFVSQSFAWAAILEYCANDRRVKSLPWTDKNKIDFRLPAVGDDVPRGKDRG